MRIKVVIYTDGACLGNPGPGGYGIVLIEGKNRRELSGGFRCTTNNRMELLAAIVALHVLEGPAEVYLYSDSRYLVDAFQKRWVYKWKAQNWKKPGKGMVPNADLWKRLLELFEIHSVNLVWVQGHSGVKENERCDRLSQQAALKLNNPDDPGYVGGNRGQKSLFS